MHSFLRVAARRLALPVLVGIAVAFAAAHAEADNRDAGRIVALTVDSQARALVKAHPHKLYRRDTGADSWAKVPLPAAALENGIASVAVAAKRTDMLYVSGPGFGVWLTENGGRSWEAQNDGLPSRDVIAVATHADQPDTVYVYVADKGIFRSEDGGERWKLMDGGPRESLTQFVHSNMPGSMQTGWFFAATPAGVARSMDCFCGWYPAGGLNAKVYAVAYEPKQPQRVYAATEKGLYLSANGGEEWTRVKSPARIVTALAIMPSGTLYAASEGQLFRSTDGAKTWERVDA